MTTKRIWMIRAGRNAAYVDNFLNKGLTAIGWNQTSELEPGASREAVVERMRAQSPGHSPQRLANAAGQVFRFLSEIEPGDIACTYEPGQRRYCLGTILGECGVREHVLGRYRKVNWDRHVSRDALSVAARNSLGAIQTLFLVPEGAARELEQRAAPLGESLGEVKPATATMQDLDLPPDPGTCSDGVFGFDDIASRSSELVEDAIVALDWEEMQELAAGILRAMGYRTQVAPPGADRGVDIMASPDGLLLEEPRIFVEVKHRYGTPMGAPALRSFLGGRQAGDRCLYISTGGFTKDAKYEAERSTIPITLVDLPRLRDLLVQYYGEMDSQSAALVRLARVYWPLAS